MKTCRIIYGYTDTCLDTIPPDPSVNTNTPEPNAIDKTLPDTQKDTQKDTPLSPVLLIEPRSEYIDKIKALKRSDIVLISKVLTCVGEFRETSMYYNRETEHYWCPEEGLTVNGTNMFNVKKYTVYTITLEQIIKQYKIQNISCLVVNLNILGIERVLDSLLPYNHIVSDIRVSERVELKVPAKIFNYYKWVKDDHYVNYTHKNVNITLPKIGMYFLNGIPNSYREDVNLLINQYKINVIIPETPLQTARLIGYPQCLQNLECLSSKPQSKIYYENVIGTLESIFSKERNLRSESSEQKDDLDIDVNDLDIIIQFDAKYFGSKRTLQIMYPLKDDTVYVNKMHDIMYATKNCMYMIYQIMKSKYFTDYIESKRTERPGLFKIFAKRYFYEYLSKIFVFKEF